MATIKYFDGEQWIDISGGSGGTSDYTALTNKPQINSVLLTGNRTLSQLGIAEEDHVHEISEITQAGTTVVVLNCGTASTVV